VLPNHACMTGAAHDAYNIIDGGTEVLARWPRCNGW
jgi:D-serine deaminase-like pyridoxal phosphate-dependent protein